MTRFLIAPLTLLAAFATVSLGTGCSPNDPFQSKGQNGVAEFKLQAAQCLFGCNTDKPVLLGSEINVQATLTSRSDPMSIRVRDLATGTTENASQSCTCEGDNGSTASVTCEASCNAGQTKSALVSVDIQTKTAGNVAIELVDAQGNVVDSSQIVVRPPATLSTYVKSAPKATDGVPVTPDADGAYSVHVGNEVDLNFGATDDQGNDLAFTRHGVIPTYSNKSALAPTKEVGALLFGSTNDEIADAVGVGDGEISLAAEGATTSLKFHVVK